MSRQLPKTTVPKSLLAKRQQKLRAEIKRLEVDAFLVTDPLNVRYLTGFTGDSSYLLAMPRRLFLMSDSRYEIQIAEECTDIDVDIRTAKTSTLSRLAAMVSGNHIKNLAIEAESMTCLFRKQVAEELAGIELIDTDSIILQHRAIKDSYEIDTIRWSIGIAERAISVIRAQLVGTQTELEIAHNLEHTIRQFGGQRCAFDPIVGVGPRAALPHGYPSSMQIQASPFVLIDWGAQFNGYASDLTRIFVTGRISAKLRKVYETVLQAQMAAIESIRPGIAVAEVDRAARSIIERAGYAKHFGHGLGHGFGLQIHELPRMAPTSHGALHPGMVVTVEPGIYLPDWGGVRIEDDVLVTEDGHEVLSTLTKELDESVVERL